MEQYLELASVPVITIIVYWILDIIKSAFNNDEKFKRFIPLSACLLGVICGIVAFYALPGFIPAKNIVAAILIVGASGLSATGTHQIFKQLSKQNPTNNKNPEN